MLICAGQNLRGSAWKGGFSVRRSGLGWPEGTWFRRPSEPPDEAMLESVRAVGVTVTWSPGMRSVAHGSVDHFLLPRGLRRRTIWLAWAA